MISSSVEVARLSQDPSTAQPARCRSAEKKRAASVGMTGFAFVVLGVGSKPAPLKAKGAAPGVENVRSRHCPSPSQPARCGSAEEKAGCFGREDRFCFQWH